MCDNSSCGFRKNNSFFPHFIETACHIEREMAVSMDDSFMPVCQDDGSYAPVQCFEHKGFGKQCWCVDDEGEEIGDTRTTDGSTPTCEKGSTIKSLRYRSKNSERSVFLLSESDLNQFSTSDVFCPNQLPCSMVGGNNLFH